MPRRLRRLGLPAAGTGLCLLAILIGALVWFVPYLTRERAVITSVAAPAALDEVDGFGLKPGQQACMSSVAVTPTSRVAEFSVAGPKPSVKVVPALEFTLAAEHYNARSRVAGGHPTGIVDAPIAPPRRSLIATACFVDRGHAEVLLLGAREARTIARSPTTVAGSAVLGDIALTFLDSPPRSLLDSLGEVFEHASSLTDDLIPVWLIWVLAALVSVGVPLGIAAALHRALREDELASQRPEPHAA